MNYKLNTTKQHDGTTPVIPTLKKLLPFLMDERSNVVITLIAVIINSLSTLVAPVIIAFAIDTYFVQKNFSGILMSALILLVIYLIGSIANYIQTLTMGGVGRRLLFSIRNALFNTLQDLPIDFFNQNTGGDLISRINNDTDKLNQFISQALIQFIGNFFLIAGTALFILVLHFQLALVTLIPALLVLIITLLLTPWIARKNLSSLQSLGALSTEIQESLANFKVILAFDRLDYFRKKFARSNESNYLAARGAGIASTIFVSIYGLASNLASLLSLFFGLYLVQKGQLSLGVLVSFQLYVFNFYSPLKQLATVWSSFQLSLASLDRIGEVLELTSDMRVIKRDIVRPGNAILDFSNVSFHYPEGKNILEHVSFSLEKGKTYAFVGPTGGGKTTTASLMARLYDPSEGIISLDGYDIRSYSSAERSGKIGFILQEPFLFSGSLAENIVYGHPEYTQMTPAEIEKLLESSGLLGILSKFEGGLTTPVTPGSESMSLGQKQLIAFIRAYLRQPEILILDEATANIDTVTELLLDEILQKLPPTTTKVIIAHRLSTIKDADVIYFVNGGIVTPTLSLENTIEMLKEGQRTS